MRWATAAVAMLVVSALLSGCSGGSDETPEVAPDQRPELLEGKGAIAGLLIDDVYRPVPGGLIFIEGLGLTATTDAHGQFQFLDLEPGTYVLLADTDNHEAAPINVDVTAGEYTEVEFSTRRIFSQDGRTVTTAFSVFISCAFDFVADGIVYDCTADQSGDSDRAAFVSDYRDYGSNATYLLTEMLASKDDRYEVQVRSSDCSGSGGGYYAVSQFKGNYTRLLMPFNGTSEQSAEASYGPNAAWTNKCKVQTILFSDSEGREELQGVLPVCCGAGAHFGIKAKFVATLFLGPPETDIEHYCVLSSC